jgi:hypothetical protein
VNILASRFRQREIEAELERKVAAIVLEVGAEAPKPMTASLPLDPWRLRGVPVVGRRGAIGGSVRGSQPDRDAPSLH